MGLENSLGYSADNDRQHLPEKRHCPGTTRDLGPDRSAGGAAEAVFPPEARIHVRVCLVFKVGVL